MRVAPIALVPWLAVVACGAPVATARTTAVVAPPAPAPAPSPADVQRDVAQARALLQRGDVDTARRRLAAARGAAGTDPRLLDDVDYLLATAAAYAHDLARAAEVLSARAAAAHARADGEAEAHMENCVTWVRWAQDDLAAALAANARMGAALAPGSLPADHLRAWSLHYLWDRAYLLRDAAEAAPAAARDAARQAAQAARAAFDAAAHLPDDGDGVGVLAAYFSLRDGDARTAAAALRDVGVAADGDVQDLYIVARVVAAAGDAAAAGQVRTRIVNAAPYLMVPLIVAQMRRDADAGVP